MTFESLRQDVQYAVRGLRKKPGFTLAVVLTLGLGIGANAAMFGIVDQLLFRPPPLLRDPATAHRIYTAQTFRGKESFGGVSRYARYVDLSTGTTSFSQTAGFTSRPLAVGTGENASEMQIGVVSASFFGFFDAPPVIGRYFTEREDQPPAGEPVAVLSDAMWQSRYGGRRDALGSKLQIGPTVYTIIGVAPRAFVGLWPDRPPVAYIPITSYAAGTGFKASTAPWWKTYSWGWMSMLARRKPGVTIARANADLTAALQRSYLSQLAEQPRSTPIALAKPHAIAGSIFVERGPNASSVGKVATWLGGVSLIVLLIACANVANLMLARALRRKREIALRVALGVSRARLVSQLLTESVLLALIGGLAGLVIAQITGGLLRARLLDQSEAASGFGDPRTIAFAFAAAFVVGIATGLAPVFQAGRVDLTGDLKAGMREGTYARSRARVALLVLQAALSVVLLVGAGLFVRSLRNVESVRLGFDVKPVMLVDLNMRGMPVDSAQMVALRTRLLDAARRTPGVENASLQVTVPFWSSMSRALFVEGIDTVGRLGQFDLNAVSPEFFATAGTRIVRGRGITREDTPTSPPSMVVSENMAKALWPGRDAIGKCVRINADTMPCTYVVGIAENIKDQSLSADSSFFYYLPAAQYRPQQGGLLVRMRGSAADAKETIRRRLQREMPGSAYITITPLETIVGSQTRSWHLGATMFAVFGGLALLLAAIGLYSVIAYSAAQRTHELGIRRALGAQAAHVIRVVVADGLAVAGVGVAIGIGVSLYASKWIEPLLFDVRARDPLVFAVVALALVVVAALASWVPARRAARVDASVALRTD